MYIYTHTHLIISEKEMQKQLMLYTNGIKLIGIKLENKNINNNKHTPKIRQTNLIHVRIQ